jgi:hypothetical protein
MSAEAAIRFLKRTFCRSLTTIETKRKDNTSSLAIAKPRNSATRQCRRQSHADDAFRSEIDSELLPTMEVGNR